MYERKIQKIKSRFLRTYLSHQSTQLEPVPSVDRVCPKLPETSFYRVNIVSVHAQLPDSCFPGQWNHHKFRLWTTGSKRARGSETQHIFQADTRRSDPPQYHLGQKVWLSTRDILSPNPSLIRSSCLKVTEFIPVSMYHC